MVLLARCQLATRFDVVPLGQAASAACCRRVLCHKDRMTAKWRLFPVIRGLGRREPSRDEIARVLDNDRHSLSFQIFALFDAQMETLTKS